MQGSEQARNSSRSERFAQPSPAKGGSLVCRTSAVCGGTPDGRGGRGGNDDANFPIQALRFAAIRPFSFSRPLLPSKSKSLVQMAAKNR